MLCARCGEEIDREEGLPVPTTRPDGTSGYLCGKCARETKGDRDDEEGPND